MQANNNTKQRAHKAKQKNTNLSNRSKTQAIQDIAMAEVIAVGVFRGSSFNLGDGT